MVCGKCHEKEKAVYLTSVHGKAVMEKQNSKAARLLDLPHLAQHRRDQVERDQAADHPAVCNCHADEY